MADSKEVPPPNQAPPPVTPKKVAEEVKKLTPVHTKPLLIAGGAAFVVIVILLFMVVVFNQPATAPVFSSPLPSAATSSASPVTGPLSEIGKTEAYQKFEQKLNDLRNANEKIDLSEATLTFPLLDMNVNFEKN